VALPGYRILPPEAAGAEYGKGTKYLDYEQFMRDTELLFVRGLK
jgi:hypothetical protein